MIASTLAALSLLGLFGGDVTAEQHFTYTTAHAPTLRVETLNGSIAVTTGGNRVAVTATKRADSMQTVEALKVSASQSGDTITVRAIFPKDCWNCGGSISFDVAVPAGTKVVLVSTNGSVKAAGLSADANLNSTNGSVSASYASATGVRSIALSSTNGSITLSLPSNAKIGRVRADTTVGHISSAWNLSVDRTNVVGSSADQTLTPGGTSIQLTTTTGGITLDKT